MGRKVKVKYVQKQNTVVARICLKDMTVGAVYDAYLPDEGELDKDLQPVLRKDEVWIFADDAGDEVVAHLGLGLEIVE